MINATESRDWKTVPCRGIEKSNVRTLLRPFAGLPAGTDVIPLSAGHNHRKFCTLYGRVDYYVTIEATR
jgi:hypothetical protein